MPFCSACGAELGASASFCAKCGKPAGAAPGSTATPETTGMQENVAGLLCYAAGWLTGLIFFLIDKRPYVRFHAMQSIIVFGALNVLYWIVVWSGWFGGFMGWAFLGLLTALLGLLTVACWILCMVKAYQGLRFKLPVIGNLAENYSR